MKLNVLKAEFSAGYASASKLPAHKFPEIAFIGRSNVGKSSLINRLLKRRSLARVSNRPGRTQEINLFDVKVKVGEGDLPALIVADLPGFGYAKLSKAKLKSLSLLIQEYLAKRKELRVVCLLNDCRRTPGEDELILRNHIFETGRHLLVVLTKSDKLSRSKLISQTELIAKAYGLRSADLVLCGENKPIELLWERIAVLVQ